MDVAIVALVGTVFSGVLTYFGIRLTAQKSAKASQESVGVTALTAAMNAWMQQAQRTDAELQGVKTDLRNTKSHYDQELEKLKRLLSASRQYVGLLLAAWSVHLPSTPPPDPPAGYTPED